MMTKLDKDLEESLEQTSVESNGTAITEETLAK